MVGSNMRGAWSIEGLDVDEDVGVWLVVVAKDDIGGMRNGVVLHPLVDGTLASLASTLSGDSGSAKDSIEERHEGLDGRVVGCGMKSQAVLALYKVTISRSDKGVSEGLGGGAASSAASDVALSLRRR
jgi:hypothetical protein